jgi:hypothetical protein
MQFLKDAVSHTAQVTVLPNPDPPYDMSKPSGKSRNPQPRCLKVTMRRVVVCYASELKGAFAAIGRDRSKRTWRRRRIVELAAEKPVADAVSTFHPTGSFDSTKVRKVTFVRSDVLIPSQLPAAPIAH